MTGGLPNGSQHLLDSFPLVFSNIGNAHGLGNVDEQLRHKLGVVPSMGTTLAL